MRLKFQSAIKRSKQSYKLKELQIFINQCVSDDNRNIMIKFLVQNGIGACASRKRKHLVCTEIVDKDQLSAVSALQVADTKAFQCDFPGCSYACTTSCSLTSHKLTHTGEKPFQCDFPGCDYACTTSCSLTRHKRTHTGEKPFQCDVPGM